MTESSEFKPDGRMNEEEAAIASSLPPELIQIIDDALLSNARSSNRKVAMIVAKTMENPELRVPGLPDTFYAERVRKLVAQGALEAAGNSDFMRFSEVRLPG